MIAMLLGVAVLLVAAGAAATTAHHSTGGAAVEYRLPMRLKRDPLGFNARGFHDDIFGQEFGVFHTVKRSRSAESVGRPLLVGVAESGNSGRYKRESKRRPEMGSSGFHGDTFSGGFGEFWTMKKKGHVKRDPEVPEPVAYTDIWSDNGAAKMSSSEELPTRFEGGAKRQLLKNKADWLRILSASFPVKPYTRGDEDAVLDKLRSHVSSIQKEENPDLRDATEQSSAVYEMSPQIGEGLELRNRFADLWKTGRNSQQDLQKRRPEMGSSGFHGNMFSNGFGEFWPMKKKSKTSAMYGDAGVDKMLPMKRRPEMDSLGFHGDTFHNGFGDFWPMKRSIPTENFAVGRSGPLGAQDYAHYKERCMNDKKADLKISVH